MKNNLAVIVVNYNTMKMTIDCLNSVVSQLDRVGGDLYVVDNGSTDGSVDTMRKLQITNNKLQIIENKKNLGFAGGNNLVLKQIIGNYKYYLLLNSDTLLQPGVLETLLLVADKNKFGILSCRLVDINGKFQANGGGLPTPWPVFVWLSGLDDIFHLPSYQERLINRYRGTKEFGWVSGTAMLIKDDVFDKIGLLDDRIFMYGEDIDYCWRAKKSGFKVGWTDKCQITHFGGRSSNNPKYHQWKGEFNGLLYLYQKYYGVLAKIGLKILIYIFVAARCLAYLFLGKAIYAKNYAKVLVNI